MYSVKRFNVFKNWNSKCYLAKKLDSVYDDFGNEIPKYEKPNEKPYTFNIQPLTGTSEAREFGEQAVKMKVALITERAKYENTFHEFDLAYLDGATPDGEEENGQNANYRVYAVLPQNVALKVYFLKIK